MSIVEDKFPLSSRFVNWKTLPQLQEFRNVAVTHTKVKSLKHLKCVLVGKEHVSIECLKSFRSPTSIHKI